MSTIAPLMISLMALVFTVFSFWWMNWRPAKLVVGAPRTYAASGSKSETLVDFPLIFFNRGATPVVVHNLRLRIPGCEPLSFIAVSEKIGQRENRGFATQFAVRPNEIVSMICEFQRRVGGIEFEARSYPVILEAVYGDNTSWRRISEFALNVSSSSLPKINNGPFLAYDNWTSD